MSNRVWRAINPFGAVFDRELRASARRRRTYVVRVAYLGFLLLFLWGSYNDVQRMMGGAGIGAVARGQMLQMIGMQFLETLIGFTLGAMMLTGPVLTCTAIGGERLAKTLPVLLATPLGAWSIVSGKLLSKVLTALMMIALSLPALAAVRLLGGVETADMLGGLGACAAVLVFGAAVGLLLSVWVNRAYAVILLAFAVEFGVYLLAPLLIQELRAGNGWARWAEQNLWPLHPVLVLGERLNPWSATRYTDWWRGTWWPVILGHLGAGAVLLVCSAIALRRVARRAEERVNPAPADAKPGDEKAAGKMRPARGEVVVGDNAVLWREWRRPLLAKRGHAVVGLLAVAGLLGLVYYLTSTSQGGNPQDTQIMFGVLFCILGTLLVTVLSATVIAQEKESDTWTLLLAAPVSPGQVVWGKVAGVVRKLAWPAGIMVAHLTFFAAAGTISWKAAAWVAWCVLSFGTTWLGTGVLLSLWMRRTTSAVVVNMMLVVSAWAVLPVVVQLLTNGRTGELLILADPIFWVVEGIKPLSGSGSATIRMPGFSGNGIEVREFVWYGVTAGLVAMVVGMAALRAAHAHFDRIVGRAASGGRAGAWRRRSRDLVGSAVGSRQSAVGGR